MEESLAIRRDLGDRAGMTESLCTLGMVVREQGNILQARALLREGLTISVELGIRSIVGNAMDGIAACSSEAVLAARIWGAAERLREEIDAPMVPEDIPRFNRDVAAARHTLADTIAFDRAWKEGRAMTMEQAIEHAYRGNLQ